MDGAPRWRKSSFTGQQDCVEVSHHLDAVRDSKYPLVALEVDMRRLLDVVRRGQFDR